MPDQGDNTATRLRTIAYVGPFVLFMLFIGLLDVLSAFGFGAANQGGPWYRAFPRQWVYPLQTVACAVALAVWWRHFEFRPHRGLGTAVLAGVAGTGIWIAPGWLFEFLQMSDGWWRYLGFADRSDGFNPAAVAQPSTGVYLFVVAFRFLRLAVVVPLIEEIFWRGFLMRYTADPDGDYWTVPFGTFHRHSLIIVTGLFVLIHSPVDYCGALVYGLLAYFVAVRTKSLSACVLMHAVANLLLGTYVMLSGQWGYW